MSSSPRKEESQSIARLLPSHKSFGSSLILRPPNTSGVHQIPVESTGQNRTTFAATIHQRNSIDSTSLPAGTVQTGRKFRILQVRGGQSSRTHRLHTSARPTHHQHKIRGRRGKSPSPVRVHGRLSLFRRAGLVVEGRPRCRRHFVDSRQSTRHFPLVAQSRFSRHFLSFCPAN